MDQKTFQGGDTAASDVRGDAPGAYAQRLTSGSVVRETALRSLRKEAR